MIYVRIKIKAHSEYEGKTVSNDDIKQFFSEEYKIHTVGEKLLSFATQEPAEIKEDKLYVHSSFLEEWAYRLIIIHGSSQPTNLERL